MLYKSLLKNKNYYLLMGYQLVNNLADKLFQFCIPWFVYDLTKSDSQMVFTFGFGMASHLLFSLFGGAFVDYFDRRKILLWTSCLSGLTLLLFSICIFTDFISPSVHFLYALNFLMATYNAFDLPAFDASVVEYFERNEFVSVNASLEIILSFINIVGPLIAGLIISTLGSEDSIFVISFFYLLSFIFVKFSYPLKKFSVGEKVRSIGQLIYENGQIIKEGIAYVFRPECPLLLLLMMTFLSNVVFGTKDALIIFLARDQLSLNAENLASGISTLSIIALVSITVLSGPLSRFNIFTVMVSILLVDASCSVGIGLASNKLFLLGFYGLTLISESLFNIFGKTFRQAYAPPHMTGRIAGITRGMCYSAAGLGAVISGVLLEFINVRTFFVFGGVFIIFVAVVSFYLQKFYHPSVFTRK